MYVFYVHFRAHLSVLCICAEYVLYCIMCMSNVCAEYVLYVSFHGPPVQGMCYTVLCVCYRVCAILYYVYVQIMCNTYVSVAHLSVLYVCAEYVYTYVSVAHLSVGGDSGECGRLEWRLVTRRG